MSFDVDLKLVIRSGYASAVAAMNHATAAVTDRTAAAEFISHHLTHTLQAQGIAHSLTHQELSTRVYALLLGASAVLDEQNFWGISNLSEFAWDYLLLDEVLVSSVEALLTEAYTASDLCASAQTTGISDQLLAFDLPAADIALATNDGGERTYFSGDYSLGGYDAAQNSTEEVRAADVQTTTADLTGLADQYLLVMSLPLNDTSPSSDGVSAGAAGVQSEACSTAEVSTSSQTSSRGDTSTATDSANTLVAITLSEGITRTYFADDYAAADYNAPYNSHEDSWVLAFGAALADAQPADAAHYAHVEIFAADGEARTYFAADYAAADYNLPEGAVSAMHTAEVATGAVDAAYFAEVTTAYAASGVTDMASFAETSASGTDLAASDQWGTPDSFAATSGTLVTDPVALAEVVTYVAAGVFADASVGTEINTASWTLPSWAEAAVPIDTVALALTVAASDTSAHIDSSSAVIQNYAFDPAYFSGDYATTAY